MTFPLGSLRADAGAPTRKTDEEADIAELMADDDAGAPPPARSVQKPPDPDDW